MKSLLQSVARLCAFHNPTKLMPVPVALAAMLLFGPALRANAPQAQTIAGLPPVLPDKAMGAPDFAINNVSATSGLPVEFSVLSGPASVSGNTVTVSTTETGSVVIAANQSGNADYLPAPQATTTLRVGPAAGALLNTTFVITNNSGYHEDDIYVAFAGAIPQPQTPSATTPNQTYGDGRLFNQGSGGFVSKKLSDLKGTITVNGVQQDAYTFSLNNFNSGRLYISYTRPLTAPPAADKMPDFPFGIYETTVAGEVVTTGSGANEVPQSVQSNHDISYVDGVSIPMKTTVLGPDFQTVLPAPTYNPVTTNADILTKLSQLMPHKANIVASGGTLKGKVVRTLAPAAAAAAYHDWNSLMDHLQSTKTALKVADYTSPNIQPLQPFNLANVLFGYAGGGQLNPGVDPRMLNPQSYTFTANFLADLNPDTSNPPGKISQLLTGYGIPQGTPGVILSGTTTGADPVPGFDIYITRDALNAATGIYGSNPVYVVIANENQPGSEEPLFHYKTNGVYNDLTGRIVGDLMAGMVFGWASSSTDIQTHATSTGLTLYGITFSGETISDISTGEFFFLMSLAASEITPTDNSLLLDWLGAGINPNPQHYDVYAYAVMQESFAYGTGFGDRFQGLYNPDTTWFNAYPPANPLVAPPVPYEVVGFVELELLKAGFPLADEPLAGDFSDNPLVPSFVGLAPGENRIRGTVQADDFDFFSFEVPEGSMLGSFRLAGFSLPGDPGAIAIQQGDTWDEDAHDFVSQDFGQIQVGSNLLSVNRATPLAAGTYTVRITHDGAPAAYEFSLVLEPVLTSGQIDGLAGTYAGNFVGEIEEGAGLEDHLASLGHVEIQVGGRSRYSGSINLGGERLPLRGNFDPTGRAVRELRTTFGPGVLYLALADEDPAPRVYALLEIGGRAIELVCHPAAFSGRSGSVFPLADSSINVLLPAENATHGYAILRARPDGTLNFSGLLPGNFRLTGSSRVVEGETGELLVPTALSLPGRGGFLHGEAVIDASPTRQVDELSFAPVASWLWLRNGGEKFLTTLDAFGQLWPFARRQPLMPGGAPVSAFIGSTGLGDLQVQGNLNDANRIDWQNPPPRFRLGLRPGDGLLNGQSANGAIRALMLLPGVVIETDHEPELLRAAGFVRNRQESAPVEITSPLP